MITDLTALLPGSEEAPGFLLDVPVAGRDGPARASGHDSCRRASRRSRTSSTSLASASRWSGPRRADLLARFALGMRVDPEWLERSAEGDWRSVRGVRTDGMIVVKTHDVWPPAWNVYGPVGCDPGPLA